MSIHYDELGHFVDTLSPHQRVYLQRLLGESLAAVPHDQQRVAESVPDRGYEDRLAAEGLEPLFNLLSCLRAFSANDEDSDIRPFAVRMPEPGHALVVLSPRILSWRGVWEAHSHDWVRELHVGKVTVDLARLRDLNSATIAWLVTLSHQVPGKKITLIKVSDAMRRAIAVLSLSANLLIGDPPTQTSPRPGPPPG